MLKLREVFFCFFFFSFFLLIFPLCFFQGLVGWDANKTFLATNADYWRKEVVNYWGYVWTNCKPNLGSYNICESEDEAVYNEKTV